MTDSHALAEFLSRESLIVTGLFWVTLQAGQAHTHFRTPEAGFLFVLKGEGRFDFEGTRYEAAPGSVLHGGEDMRLDYRIGEHSELEYCLIHYASSHGPQQFMKAHYQLNPGLQPVIVDLLHTLRDSVEMPGLLPTLRVKILFYRLLYETLACCELQSSPAERDTIVKDALAYIQANYMNVIRLTDMADRYGISAGFFSSQFRKHTGVSPIDYLIQFRIRRAREMLLMNRHSVREIAQAVGYSDVYYFSRLFKQHTGIAPSRLRPAARPQI